MTFNIHYTAEYWIKDYSDVSKFNRLRNALLNGRLNMSLSLWLLSTLKNQHLDMCENVQLLLSPFEPLVGRSQIYAELCLYVSLRFYLFFVLSLYNQDYESVSLNRKLNQINVMVMFERRATPPLFDGLFSRSLFVTQDIAILIFWSWLKFCLIIFGLINIFWNTIRVKISLTYQGVKVMVTFNR